MHWPTGATMVCRSTQTVFRRPVCGLGATLIGESGARNRTGVLLLDASLEELGETWSRAHMMRAFAPPDQFVLLPAAADGVRRGGEGAVWSPLAILAAHAAAAAAATAASCAEPVVERRLASTVSVSASRSSSDGRRLRIC